MSLKPLKPEVTFSKSFPQTDLRVDLAHGPTVPPSATAGTGTSRTRHPHQALTGPNQARAFCPRQIHTTRILAMDPFPPSKSTPSLVDISMAPCVYLMRT